MVKSSSIGQPGPWMIDETPPGYSSPIAARAQDMLQCTRPPAPHLDRTLFTKIQTCVCHIEYEELQYPLKYLGFKAKISLKGKWSHLYEPYLVRCGRWRINIRYPGSSEILHNHTCLGCPRALLSDIACGYSSACAGTQLSAILSHSCGSRHQGGGRSYPHDAVNHHLLPGTGYAPMVH